MNIKNIIWRGFFYLAGLFTLAIGIVLNTKAGLGVSPIISVPYSISRIWGLNFGNMTFLLYIVLVLIQILIKKRETGIMDLLQIILSIIFTRVLNLLGIWIQIRGDSFFSKIGILLCAIVLTGVGAAMSVNARVVANPGDGIVYTIANKMKKDMGLIKNLTDLTCITITIVIGIVFNGKPVGVGLGTVIAVLGVGRVIWLYNHLFKEKVHSLSGLKLY